MVWARRFKTCFHPDYFSLYYARRRVKRPRPAVPLRRLELGVPVVCYGKLSYVISSRTEWWLESLPDMAAFDSSRNNRRYCFTRVVFGMPLGTEEGFH